MWASLQAPLFFGLLAAFVTSIGLIAVATRAEWSQRHSGLFALAASGMLLTLTLLHIAPEAFENSTRAPQLMLTGFLGGLVLHYVIRTVFGDPEEVVSHMGAITPVIAIAIHSFLDGVIYAVTFAANATSGAYAALSLIMHEFPEGVIAFAILRRSGISNRWSFGLAFLAAAATTPLGVLVSTPFVHVLGQAAIGDLFAMSAGLLLFVATGPLMAPLSESPPARSLTALGFGVAVGVAMTLTPLGGHAH